MLVGEPQTEVRLENVKVALVSAPTSAPIQSNICTRQPPWMALAPLRAAQLIGVEEAP